MGLLKDSRMAADTTTEGPTRAFRSFATASAAEMEDVENKRLQTLNSSMASLGPLPSLATLAQSSAPLSLLARRTSLNNMNTNAVSGASGAGGVATSAASAAANFATSLVSSFSSFSSSLSSSSNSSPTRRPTPVKATTTTTTTSTTATATSTSTATAISSASATATSTATNSNNGSPNSSRPLTSASASASATSTSTTTLGLERAVERMLLLAGSTPSPSFVSANDSASLSEMLFLENDAFAASPVSDPLSASSASSASSAATFDGDFMDECASVAPSDRQWRLARAREHALRELQLSKAAAAEAADAAAAAAAATATNRSPRNTVRSSSQPCFGSESDTDTSPSRESKDDSDINNSSNSDDSELFSLTPGRRRSVSWGDVSGAGLVDSVCFWQDDAPCRCGKKKEVGAARPKSPYLDSELPLSHRELMRQLSEQGVQLEHSMIRWPLVFLSIRVLNLGFEKSVFLRTSSDGWKTHTDVPASYLEQASDRLTDEFQAALRVPSTTTQDETEFAICCQMNGREYWDNNNGRNYRMQFCHRHQSILGAPSPAGPNACCSPTVPQSPLKPCLKAKPW